MRIVEIVLCHCNEPIRDDDGHSDPACRVHPPSRMATSSVLEHRLKITLWNKTLVSQYMTQNKAKYI